MSLVDKSVCDYNENLEKEECKSIISPEISKKIEAKWEQIFYKWDSDVSRYYLSLSSVGNGLIGGFIVGVVYSSKVITTETVLGLCLAGTMFCTLGYYYAKNCIKKKYALRKSIKANGNLLNYDPKQKFEK